MHVTWQTFQYRLLGILSGAGGSAVDKEDDVLGGIAGLDLGELGAGVGTCRPVDGGVAAVGDGDVLALEGGAVDGGEVIPRHHVSTCIPPNEKRVDPRLTRPCLHQGCTQRSAAPLP